MLVCEAPELVPWQPNFSSSGQASPLWTRLVCDGLEICNTMEGSHWADPELVQVIVCEECGHPGCAGGGYARLSRLASYVLLSRPFPDPGDPWYVSEYRPSHAIGKHGAVAVPLAAWTRWCERFDNLPHPDALPPSRRSHLDAAWRLERIYSPRDEGAPPARVLRDRLIAAALRSTEEASAISLRSPTGSAPTPSSPSAATSRAPRRSARRSRRSTLTCPTPSTGPCRSSGEPSHSQRMA